MYKKLDYIKEIINLILYGIMYYVILSEIFSFIDKHGEVLIGPLYVVFISIIFYFLRRFIKSKIITYILHIISGIVLYIPVLFLKISGIKLLYFFIEYFLICIWSISFIKYRDNGEYIKRPNLFFALVLGCLLIFTSRSDVILVNGILVVIYVVLHFLSMYINNIYNYVSFYKINRKFRFRDIFVVNNLYTFLFFIGTFLFAIGAKILHLDLLLGKILSPVINQISYMFSLEIDFTNHAISNEDTDENNNLFNQNVTTNAFWAPIAGVIFNILRIIFIIGIVILICYIIYKIRLSFIKYNKVNEEDKYEELIEDNDEGIDKNQSKILNKIKGQKYKDNNERIRRIYYKKIVKYKEHIKELTKLTHLQISKKVKDTENIDIEKLTKLYEKARYSSDKCTEKDIKDAKDAL